MMEERRTAMKLEDFKIATVYCFVCPVCVLVDYVPVDSPLQFGDEFECNHCGEWLVLEGGE